MVSCVLVSWFPLQNMQTGVVFNTELCFEGKMYRVACSCILSPDLIPGPLLAAQLVETWTIKRGLSKTGFWTFEQNVTNIVSCEIKFAKCKTLFFLRIK